MWGCRPSQLNDESIEDVEAHMIVYSELMGLNPFFG